MENSVIQEDLENIVKRDLPLEKWKNKTFLVSGASGFLASYIVKALLYLNLKIKVIAVVRNEEKARQVFKDFIKDKHLKIFIHDINNPLNNNIKADYIIHAASYASPKKFAVNPAGVLLPNTIGTYNLLELARCRKTRRFVFISSAEIYGQKESGSRKIGENDYGVLDPTDQRSCYGESKRMGENMCIVWMKQFGVPVNMVRLFHTYGPGMDLTDGRIQADLVSNVVKGENLVLKSSGEATRAFCYVADAVAGIFTVLIKGKTGESYNIGNENAEISVSGLAETLCGLFPEKKLKVIYQKRKVGDKYLRSKYLRVRPNTDKIRKLGWKPKYTLKNGFKRMVDSYL